MVELSSLAFPADASRRPEPTACVLVVDDLPDVRFSFLFMLHGLGYQVAEAADGESALAIIARQRIDFVLTDIYMPGMDGRELARAIRALPPPRPCVIAMSGAVEKADEDSLHAQWPGVDAVLRKPVTRDRLLETLRRLRNPPPPKRDSTIT